MTMNRQLNASFQLFCNFPNAFTSYDCVSDRDRQDEFRPTDSVLKLELFTEDFNTQDSSKQRESFIKNHHLISFLIVIKFVVFLLF